MKSLKFCNDSFIDNPIAIKTDSIIIFIVPVISRHADNILADLNASILFIIFTVDVVINPMTLDIPPVKRPINGSLDSFDEKSFIISYGINAYKLVVPLRIPSINS